MRTILVILLTLAALLCNTPGQTQHSREDTQRLHEDLLRLCELYNYPGLCIDSVNRVIEAHTAFVRAMRSKDQSGLAQARRNYNQSLARLHAIAPTLWNRYVNEMLGQDI
jgi:hypothetical protein